MTRDKRGSGLVDVVATGMGHAVDVGQPTGPVGTQRARRELRTHAGNTEPRALFVGERGDGHRDGWNHATPTQDVDRGEGGHDPERPVERAPVGYRVQM